MQTTRSNHAPRGVVTRKFLHLSHWGTGLVCGMIAVSTGGCDVSIQTSHPLFPDYNRDIEDYVVRCVDGPIHINVLGESGGRAVVDGRVVRVGSSTEVSLTSGQAFTLSIPHSSGGSSFHSVRCLPEDFPQFSLEEPVSPQAEYYIVTPGLAFTPEMGLATLPQGTSPQYVAMFDTSGVPVWWRKSQDDTVPLDAKLLPNGNLAWLHFTTSLVGIGGGSEERRLDGSLVRSLNTVGGGADHHEIQLLPNGNYAIGRYLAREDVDLSACGGPDSGIVIDSEIQELSPTGELVWSWNTADHIPLQEVQWTSLCTAESGQYDLYHFNSIEPDGDAFVVSFRHLNAIYKISRSTGEVTWKLGGTPTAQSLQVSGDPLQDAGGLLFGGQHDARRLADGTWTVYDNRTFQTDDKPRAMRFSIDESARTATVVELVTDPEVSSSQCCGSARKLSSGNWVTAWGAYPAITELTPTGEVAYRLRFPQGIFTYRADPVMPGVIGRASLREAMNAQYPRLGESVP
jgi:hypothetical protein